MDILRDLLRESLLLSNITQTAMAQQIGTSQQNISDYIYGKRTIPADHIVVWAIVTRSPELIYEWERSIGIRQDGHLNNVNLEPLHVAAKWLEEVKEAEKALRELIPRLVNKTHPEHYMCESLREDVRRALDEVYDAEKASRYLRFSFTKVGFDPREVELRHEAKSKARGYRVAVKKRVLTGGSRV
ncbi:helix-turn-helix domain-containing protein [Brevibacillus agri]|uniref:helix-turn-helix domain-containing protein n=1 Tax=Brevibacillus agri TaxID=51101 RepID=UPI001C8D7492|nr:helix-turn-helix domain-containing protein [Brevibacillus agri]MBY0052322.1 helix-turn-helix domain-containing protein [Brevibacillus agri]